MKMNKDDQNTFIMIGTILVVSLVTFIAIFNIIWGIIAQPLNDALGSIGYFLRTQNIDYRFQVPTAQSNTNNTQKIDTSNVNQEPQDEFTEKPIELEEEIDIINTSETTAVDSNRVVDYNFVVPKENINNAAINFESYPDAIINDAVLAGYGSGNDTPQVNLQIIIPKIGVNSPVLQGLGADDLLEKGFWIYPGSNTLGEGEVVMLCHRRYFGPYDPRSCWFLDKLAKGDEIVMRYTDTSLRYEVVGVNVFDGDDPLIYSISDSEDYIKIVTCTPLYSNAQRLVVLAKRLR